MSCTTYTVTTTGQAPLIFRIRTKMHSKREAHRQNSTFRSNLLLSILTALLFITTASASKVALQPNTLQPRAEAVGGACSNEGQWNCMTHTWQRCASGRWSVVMDCAKGTICTPAGLTDNFRVQHDGSGGATTTSGGSGSGGGTSSGPVARTMSVGLLVAVFWGWAVGW